MGEVKNYFLIYSISLGQVVESFHESCIHIKLIRDQVLHGTLACSCFLPHKIILKAKQMLKLFIKHNKNYISHKAVVSTRWVSPCTKTLQ